MKKILVTGATGFAGSHLLRHLSVLGSYELFGTYLTDDSLKNVSDISQKINFEKLDISLTDKVEDLILKIKPDHVFHLAAMASSAKSFEDPRGTLVSNIETELNILEGVRKANSLSTRILIVSSAEIYGKVNKDNNPLNEDAPFNPTSSYAVSKIAQDFLGLQYFLTYNLKTIRVRPFNHIGPGQAAGFVVADFAKKIVQIEKGEIEPILKVGNLETKRDFTDVRDMVRAYELLMEKGEPGEVYNIGSGVSYKIFDILEKLVALSKTKIKIEIDKTLFRPVDNPELYCDSSKMKQITNWEPTILIEKTLKDTLDYFRNII
jgi:GDP-4-dehydro-6-deoxy-D-mannose reductase